MFSRMLELSCFQLRELEAFTRLAMLELMYKVLLPFHAKCSFSQVECSNSQFVGSKLMGFQAFSGLSFPSSMVWYGRAFCEAVCLVSLS